MSNNLFELTIHEALDGMRSGAFTSVDLTRSLLDRIEAVDGDVRAYLTVTAGAGARPG